MATNSYWEKEEFEDLVHRSLIAMYESDYNKKCLKVPSFIRPNEKDLESIKKFGCYFPPEDRITIEGEIDTINDGFVNEASWGLSPNNFEKQDIKDEYFRLCYIKLLPIAPNGLLSYKKIKYFFDHKIYKVIYYTATNNRGIWIQKSFVSIDLNGNTYDTYARHQDNGRLIPLSIGTYNKSETDVSGDRAWCSATLSYYADRKYFWNVTANEGNSKATFGVYPDQIKSLFYAREMPLTETGRKRPILHWVAAHQRRLKNGIDIDIEKHLRGINEFVYQGTKFKITRPIKNNEITV